MIIKTLITFIVLLFSLFVGTAQQKSMLQNTDETPDCQLINEGKFVKVLPTDIDATGYSILYKDGYLIEFINNGEFFIKSKLTFISECNYEGEIVEVSIPNYNIKPGTKFQTSIINTYAKESLIEIITQFNGEEFTYVYQKIIK